MQETQPKPRFYSPVFAVTSTIIVYFFAQIFAGVAIAVLPFLFGLNAVQAEEWLETNAWAQFLFVLLVEAITLWLIWEILKRRNLNFRLLGLSNPKIKHIAYALAGFASYFVLYVFCLTLAKTLIPGLDLEQQQEIGFDKTTTGKQLLPIFISLVILPPLVEEIVARGFLYTHLRMAKISFITASAITSILFAVAHLGGAKEGLLWVAAIDTFILSMVLCFLREKTTSLWPSIGVHAIKNGIAFFILFNIVEVLR